MFSFTNTKVANYNKPSLAHFNTLEEAEEYAKSLAKTQGYCLSRRSSQLNAAKGGRNIMLNCVQGGHYRATRQPSIKPKKRDSLKVGCKYSIRISEHEDQWYVRPPKNEHNHEAKGLFDPPEDTFKPEKQGDLLDQRLCLALYQIEHHIKSSNDINSLKELEAWIEYKYKHGGLYPQ
ncbi:uncharacterized protein B0P05DRAFT_525809 [Gilbertella persicaria]|uniref:FAR1 domain-containing protein n=1 Tax=Rhizopus stolonifer TaxID=4846 RepID=A0A367K3N5_RHIST|nr:uncharacterized protein B0P05DRAFT_525809 [Gilbertella persicaria]KAI8092329.1 hypothetical protein B0P05DRAFT_525809 [Gilbertella persicaria]RCH96756.1 hypothetical protein CU098_010344 [Rhizopus stolonifer]